MWHTIAFVAESRKVDVQELTDFAAANTNRYGIVDDGSGPEVNTWHVDAMVRDFTAAQAANPI